MRALTCCAQIVIVTGDRRGEAVAVAEGVRHEVAALTPENFKQVCARSWAHIDDLIVSFALRAGAEPAPDSGLVPRQRVCQRLLQVRRAALHTRLYGLTAGPLRLSAPSLAWRTKRARSTSTRAASRGKAATSRMCAASARVALTVSRVTPRA